MEFIVVFGMIGFIIVATVKLKMHPVFSLIIAAIVSGLLLGLSPNEVIATIGDGFGKTLSGIGLVIAFGTVIGTFLERTGGTKVMANAVLGWIGHRRSPLAINLAGFVVAIPVFCDSGFIILSSLNKAMNKKTGISLMVFALALASGLYAAHVFVPPTPGPLAAAAIIGADLGMVLLLGLVIALPVSLTGYIWAKLVGNRLTGEEKEYGKDQDTAQLEAQISPSVFGVFLPLLAPIVLIALKSMVNYPSKPFGNGFVFRFFDFVGNPIIALLIGVLFAFLLTARVVPKKRNMWVVEALKQGGLIVLITGAGGAFGAVLRTIDIASLLDFTSNSGWIGLLICFLIAAILKTAQGSSTVAIITTAPIVALLLNSFGLESEIGKSLAVLAVGAGAMTVSHVNDSYFWVVSQFSGMNLKTALKGHTVATLLQGCVGLLAIMLLYVLFDV
ncbi:MAG: GntP family permease [Bacteroidota bacterium]